MIQQTLKSRHNDRRETILEWSEKTAPMRSKWLRKNSYFHKSDRDYLQFLIPKNLRVLELGCSTGEVLATLNPSHGIGVDISPTAIRLASEAHPQLEFIVGDIEDPDLFEILKTKGPFDIILMDSTFGYLSDIQTCMENLRCLLHKNTRLVSTYHSYLWDPLFRLAGVFGLRMSTPNLAWLRMTDIENFIQLSGLETVKREWRLLVPYHFMGLGSFINRYLATLPLIRNLCLRHYLVARLKPHKSLQQPPSVTVVIPCKNERGNIQPAIERMPKFSDKLEIIFVEGHSNDNTWEEILRVQSQYKEHKIRSFQQSGEGKGDAVRTGFDHATGDLLMILDADLTVPPEDLPKFYAALVQGKGEFINGSRLVYAMEPEAMRFLNYLANHFFARVFTYLLNQSFTDTLCGTKALSRHHYEEIVKNRSYFGDFDPFGDFDLIFGASKLNLKVLEIPIRYENRSYGNTQISRFKHGLLLLKMVIFSYRKLKAV